MHKEHKKHIEWVGITLCYIEYIDAQHHYA